MNIITFFENIAKAWSKEKRCGECWTFGAPLSNSGMNKSEPEKACCVHLFVTNYNTVSGYFTGSTGLKNRQWTDHNFIMYAVKDANIGVNTYNEQPGHCIDSSLWKTHCEPLLDCFGNGNEIDLCKFGFDDLINWRMEVVTNYQDSNYAGWRITATFREYDLN